MREFERAVVYKGLKATLVAAGDEYLEHCFGLVPTKDGLRPYVQNILTSGEQCFSTSFYDFKCVDDVLYRLHNAEVIDTVPCSQARISLVDFQDFILLGGHEFLATIRDDIMDSAILPDVPLANCYTHYNGQLIAGGVYGSWYGCGLNSVAWAPVRSLDFSRIPEAGWLHFENNKVLWMLPLGERVIVYGDTYITSLVPHQHGYGEKYVFSMGLANPFAVAGDRRSHVFVNSQGEVWKYNHNGEYQNLDYSHIFAAYIDEVRVIHRLKYNDHILTIPSLERSYNLTSDGLGEANQFITGCAYNIATGLDTVQNVFQLTTTDINFRQSSLNTIREVEVQGQYNRATCSVDITYQNDTITRNTVERPLTQTKMAVVNATGESFTVNITGVLQPTTQIDRILYRYSLSDRHHIRGASNVD